MKFVLITSNEAMADIDKGANYYNSQEKGLCKRFALVVKDAFIRIRKMPYAASIAYGDTRYKVLAKFPYIILYRVQGNIIFIARVFNTYQQPDY